MIKAVKFLLKLLLILSFFAIMLIIGAKIIEKKIVSLAIEQISKNITTQVNINKFSVSLIKKFPQAVLNLDNVTIYSSGNINAQNFNYSSADTLLHLKQLYLVCNLTDLINGKIVLNRLELKNGFANILVDKKANTNYNIFKTTNNTNNSFDILLKAVKLSKINIVYNNKFKDVEAGVFFPSFLISGEFYKKNYSIDTYGKFLINNISLSSLNFRPNTPAVAEIQLDVANNLINITKGVLNSAGINLNTFGSIELTSQTKINLTINGNNIEIAQLLNSLPLGSQFKNNFKSSGNLMFTAKINGALTKKISPNVVANFSIKQATVNYHKKNINFNKIELNGYYTNGSKRNMQTSVLSVDNIKIASSKSQIYGIATISDFTSPSIKINTNVNVDIPELMAFFKSDTLTCSGGLLTGNLKAETKLGNKQKISIYNCNPQANIKITNLNLESTNKYIDIKNLNTDIDANLNMALVKKIDGIFYGITTTANGVINLDYKKTENKIEHVRIFANAQFDDFNYNQISYLFNSNNNSTQNSITYNVKAIVKSRKASFKTYQATNIETELEVNKNGFTAKNVKLNAFGGIINGNITYKPDIQNNNILMSGATLQNVDIQQLFTGFKNFGQQFLTDSNIRGKLSTTCQIYLPIKNNTVLTDQLVFTGNINISGGELINFGPALELSKFSDIPELKHIYFSEVSTPVEISNNTITIPRMQITTNAFDVNVYGSQQLSGQYEYHVKLILSELIRGKSGRVKSLQSEFGTIEDDGLGRTSLYLKLFSENGMPKVKLDGKEMRQNLKQTLKNEVKQAKQIIKSEFKNSDIDTIKTKNKTKQTEGNFTIEWDDD